MEAKRVYETPTGPQLADLGELETKLPAPLKNKAVAWGLTLVMAAAAVLGLGGTKLHGQYTDAVREFSQTDSGYGISMMMDLSERLNAAANIITIAETQAAVPASISNARDAVDQMKAALETESPAACYEANTALGKAIDLLVQELLSAGQADQKTLDSQWDEFRSLQDAITFSSYNTVAEEYNRTASGFPASLIAGLWGAEEVETFG